MPTDREAVESIWLGRRLAVFQHTYVVYIGITYRHIITYCGWPFPHLLLGGRFVTREQLKKAARRRRCMSWGWRAGKQGWTRGKPGGSWREETQYFEIHVSSHPCCPLGSWNTQLRIGSCRTRCSVWRNRICKRPFEDNRFFNAFSLFPLFHMTSNWIAQKCRHPEVSHVSSVMENKLISS